jgi:hypothetical protein
MAYRKPFTPQQRREAFLACRSFRKHRSLLKRQFPPANIEQQRVLRQYGSAIDLMVNELRKRDRAVSTDTLNCAETIARRLATEYWMLRY